jgi:hypothetical protein
MLLSNNLVRVPLHVGKHPAVYAFAPTIQVLDVFASLRTPAKVGQAVSP